MSPWRTIPSSPDSTVRRRASLDPVAEEPADDRQEVEVAAVERRGPTSHPVAGDEQRPVEAPAVVGDEPAVERDVRREGGQQGRLIGVVGEQQLDLVEAVTLPPAEADQEGDGPRRPSRARSFRCRGRRAGHPAAAARAGRPG